MPGVQNRLSNIKALRTSRKSGEHLFDAFSRGPAICSVDETRAPFAGAVPQRPRKGWITRIHKVELAILYVLVDAAGEIIAPYVEDIEKADFLFDRSWVLRCNRAGGGREK
jgi:hypothetical protein